MSFRTKVDNATSEPIPVNVVAGGAGDGSILDGVSASVKATVKDLTNSNPLAVAVMDGSGDQITSFGGGVQYTEGDIDATITGTAMMFESAADTLRAVSAANPLPISAVQSGTWTVQQGGAPWSVSQSGTWNIGTVTTVTAVTSLTQMNGAAISMNTGVRDAGTQRVTIATNDIVPVSQSGTWTVQQGGSNWSINVAQMNGVAVTMGNGASGTGVQRVTLADDGTGIVGLFPRTSGGLTTFHLVSAATTNATNIKASAGQVYGWYIYNSNASARKVAFHNTAGTPTAGASIYFSLVIPPTSGANVEFTQGLVFATGIAITTVTGLADSDSAAVGANDLIINIWYK